MQGHVSKSACSCRCFKASFVPKEEVQLGKKHSNYLHKLSGDCVPEAVDSIAGWRYMHAYGRPPLVFKPRLPRHFNFNLMILYHVYVCLLNLRIQVIDSKNIYK